MNHQGILLYLGHIQRPDKDHETLDKHVLSRQFCCHRNQIVGRIHLYPPLSHKMGDHIHLEQLQEHILHLRKLLWLDFCFQLD